MLKAAWDIMSYSLKFFSGDGTIARHMAVQKTHVPASFEVRDGRIAILSAKSIEILYATYGLMP